MKKGVDATKGNKNIGHIAITFSYRRGRTRIHKATIDELGRPAYIRMLFNPENNSLAVQGFSHRVKDSIRVPSKLFEANGTFEISSVLFVESIRERIKWDKASSYSVSGYYDPNSKLVIFNLSEGEVINDEE